MATIKFNTERNFWERSKTFYTNQISNLKKIAQTDNVIALIAENTQGLQRVEANLKNYSHAK